MQERKAIVLECNKVNMVRLMPKENRVFQTGFAHKLMNNKYQFRKRTRFNHRLSPFHPKNKMNIAYY